MNIILNGEQKTIADSSTISDLVNELGLADKRIAVEVNLDIIPRSAHNSHALKDNDKVEIVHAIGGGQA